MPGRPAPTRRGGPLAAFRPTMQGNGTIHTNPRCGSRPARRRPGGSIRSDTKGGARWRRSPPHLSTARPTAAAATPAPGSPNPLFAMTPNSSAVSRRGRKSTPISPTCPRARPNASAATDTTPHPSTCPAAPSGTTRTPSTRYAICPTCPTAAPTAPPAKCAGTCSTSICRTTPRCAAATPCPCTSTSTAAGSPMGTRSSTATSTRIWRHGASRSSR